MNERLPYENELIQRLDELPLPDENVLWDNMKQRLAEEDDDQPVIPPIVKGCGCAGLVLLLLLIGGWLLHSYHWFNSGEKTGVVKDPSTETEKEQQINIKSNKNNEQQPADSTTILLDSVQSKNDQSIVVTDTAINNKLKEKGNDPIQADELIRNKINTSGGTINKAISIRNGYRDQRNYKSRRQNRKTKEQLNIAIKGEPVTDDKTDATETTDTLLTELVKTIPIEEVDTSATIKPVADSINHANTDSATKKAAPTDSLKKKKFHFGAGISLQQLIPLDGQKSNPYNSLGRRNSLADYIPSLYLRLYREQKWFLQSEFRYGAPQYTKDILFSSNISFDSAAGFSIITNKRIQKTFYHQVPVSFNYFVLPNLSLGLGVIFNRFRSAVVDESIYRGSGGSDSLLRKGVTSQQKADSNFSKSYTQLLIEAQYKRRRLSVGARYSAGLQSYLQFNLYGLGQRKEKNSSLQLFIRYELRRSKKK